MPQQRDMGQAQGEATEDMKDHLYHIKYNVQYSGCATIKHK